MSPGQRSGFGAQVHRCAVGSGGGWGGAAAGAAADAAGRGGGRRPLSALPRQVRADRVRLRADAGYFAGELARVAFLEGVEARSAPNASRRYGGCWTGSPRPAGATRSRCPARRSPSPTTGRTSGRSHHPADPPGPSRCLPGKFWPRRWNRFEGASCGWASGSADGVPGRANHGVSRSRRTVIRPSFVTIDPSLVGSIAIPSWGAGGCLFIFSGHGDSAKWTCEGGATAAKAGVKELTWLCQSLSSWGSNREKNLSPVDQFPSVGGRRCIDRPLPGARGNR